MRRRKSPKKFIKRSTLLQKVTSLRPNSLPPTTIRTILTFILIIASIFTFLYATIKLINLKQQTQLEEYTPEQNDKSLQNPYATEIKECFNKCSNQDFLELLQRQIQIIHSYKARITHPNQDFKYEVNVSKGVLEMYIPLSQKHTDLTPQEDDPNLYILKNFKYSSLDTTKNQTVQFISVDDILYRTLNLNYKGKNQIWYVSSHMFPVYGIEEKGSLENEIQYSLSDINTLFDQKVLNCLSKCTPTELIQQTQKLLTNTHIYSYIKTTNSGKSNQVTKVLVEKESVFLEETFENSNFAKIQIYKDDTGIYKINNHTKEYSREASIDIEYITNILEEFAQIASENTLTVDIQNSQKILIAHNENNKTLAILALDIFGYPDKIQFFQDLGDTKYSFSQYHKHQGITTKFAFLKYKF